MNQFNLMQRSIILVEILFSEIFSCSKLQESRQINHEPIQSYAKVNYLSGNSFFCCTLQRTNRNRQNPMILCVHTPLKINYLYWQSNEKEEESYESSATYIFRHCILY